MGESGLILTPMLSYDAVAILTVGTIRQHNLRNLSIPCVLPRNNLKYVHDVRPCKKSNKGWTKLLLKFSYGTIICLYMWQEDGRHGSFSLEFPWYYHICAVIPRKFKGGLGLSLCLALAVASILMDTYWEWEFNLWKASACIAQLTFVCILGLAKTCRSFGTYWYPGLGMNSLYRSAK